MKRAILYNSDSSAPSTNNSEEDSDCDSRSTQSSDISVDYSIEDDGEAFDSTHFEEVNSCVYEASKQLGKGSFGTVYAAINVRDRQKVALKYVKKGPDDKYLILEGHSNPVPQEVGLMLLVKGSSCPNIIEIIDWMEHEEYYVIVLERPSHCVDLFEFAENRDISEEISRIIICQVIQAAVTCCEHGVFHRDIKLENILINCETLEVKLLDFGCSDLMKNTTYNDFSGTALYIPPEFTHHGEIHAKPATVFSLGMVLFLLLCQEKPTKLDNFQIDFNCWSRFWLTKECCHFIRGCMLSDPVFRLPLEKLLLHPWFRKPVDMSALVADMNQIELQMHESDTDSVDQELRAY